MVYEWHLFVLQMCKNDNCLSVLDSRAASGRTDPVPDQNSRSGVCSKSSGTGKTPALLPLELQNSI